MKRGLAIVIALSFVGCPLLKSKKSGDDLDAATISVSGTGARNEKDVLRYSAEIPSNDEVVSIAKDNVSPKTYPGLGAPVATLSKGYSVTKKATYFSTGTLILFADPATPGSTLLGWVAPEELAAPAAATSGSATTTSTAPKPTGTVATTVKDAGAAVVDAGAAPTATASSGPAPGPNTLVTQVGADGKCPTGFILNGNICRRPCANDSQCPPRTFCKVRFCSATK
jgi:hypothetical protein